MVKFMMTFPTVVRMKPHCKFISGGLMKSFIFLSLMVLSSMSFAQEILLNDYDWKLTDIASKGLSKEDLFSKMDVNFVKPGSSICSNRALMWANDFKRDHDLNTAKIFLFYTSLRSENSDKVWWYHVAPIINEAGNMWVMDPAFRGFIKSPLPVEGWLQKFAKSTNCKEIRLGENELIEMIYRERTFPFETSYGRHDCYYKIAPHGYWTPNSLAMNLLGVDYNGRPVRHERLEINRDELYTACLEATSSKFGRTFGSGKKECRKYIARN